MSGVTGVGSHIAMYRRRRGLSQKALAELIGRSESWLSQVERGVIPIEKLSVLSSVADVLGLEDVRVLTGAPFYLAPNGGVQLAEVEAIRRAINGYGTVEAALASSSAGWEPPALDDLGTDVANSWKLRQASRYADLGRLLPDLLSRVEAAPDFYDGDDRLRAYELQAHVYQLARAMLRKIGETQYAWMAGDRAMRAARLAGSPLPIATGARALAMVLLSQGRVEDAERVVAGAVRGLEPRLGRDEDSRIWSVWGALMLQGSIVAARKIDRGAISEYLREAERATVRLGSGWVDPETGFGVANLAIHQVSIAVELGDSGDALQTAMNVDLSGLPEDYRERRAALLIEMARAHGQRRNKGGAVLHLLEAEQMAPEEVRYNLLVQDMVRDFLKREGKLRTPGLWPLAQRLSVVD